MMKIRKLTNRGDTIVEVLVVLAVLGLAMSISYATANRSLLNARQAQENGEASELVSSQIELLRANSLLPSADSNSPYKADVNNTASAFCFSGTNLNSFSPTPNLTGYSSYPPSCRAINGLYHLAIQRKVNTSSFTVTAYWDNVSGNGQDTVTMTYKLPQ